MQRLSYNAQEQRLFKILNFEHAELVILPHKMNLNLSICLPKVCFTPETIHKHFVG